MKGKEYIIEILLGEVPFENKVKINGRAYYVSKFSLQTTCDMVGEYVIHFPLSIDGNLIEVDKTKITQLLQKRNGECREFVLYSKYANSEQIYTNINNLWKYGI